MLLNIVSSVLFIIAADLADHNDPVGIFIGFKQFQAVNKIHAMNRVTANTNTGALAKTATTGLKHGFVGQRPGA